MSVYFGFVTDLIFQDAAWMLPASSPLKCVSPADVYLLLKSSDYVLHDIDADQLFQQCDGDTDTPEYELELVLRKWYPVDRSRELRCFVRRENLIGNCIFDNHSCNVVSLPSQRSRNETRISTTFGPSKPFRPKFSRVSPRFGKKISRENGSQPAEIVSLYPLLEVRLTVRLLFPDVFDFLLTRDLSRGHIIDFNPYCSHTDPSLFTYEELLELLNQASSDRDFIPELRVVDSRSHPAAARNAPVHQHNMIPIEALALSQGRSIEEFAGIWQNELGRSAVDAGEESD